MDATSKRSNSFPPTDLFSTDTPKVKPVVALNALKSRELLRTAQPLRRQRGTDFGFDQCDIHRVDHAISIPVFPEIGPAHRLPDLRLGQADIGGIDSSVAVYVTDQHSHGNGNVARVSAIIHVNECNCNCLHVGYAG